MRRRINGFTIVELLIVIVVIAILASVTVVAYNGIRQRTQTAAYAAAADQIDKTLRLARIQNPDLTTKPTPTSPDFVCFGTVNDYPAEGVFNAGDCGVFYNSAGDETNRYSVDQNFNNTLSSLGYTLRIGKLPTVTSVSTTSKSVVRGIFGYVRKFSPSSPSTTMVQWLTPDRSACSRGNEFISSIQKALADLIAIRDGQKTIEQVYGPNPSITIEVVPTYITAYQEMLDQISGQEGICVLSYED